MVINNILYKLNYKLNYVIFNNIFCNIIVLTNKMKSDSSISNKLKN